MKPCGAAVPERRKGRILIRLPKAKPTSWSVHSLSRNAGVRKATRASQVARAATIFAAPLARMTRIATRFRRSCTPFRVGGTGLEPVTPSLSSPQDATPTFAPARASRCLCRSFRASQHRAFARVCDLWRLLVLAPVSTGRRWCGLPRTSEQLVLGEAPRPGGAAALPTDRRQEPVRL
jgi:hypothetical protein